MIYMFGGRNFYSFKDEFCVDFRVKPQANERDIFQADPNGQKCNSVMGVFGANASGKTHLMQALGFLRWFASDSAQRNPEDTILSEMFFKFCPTPEKKIDLFVEFGFEYTPNQGDYKHYRYELSFENKLVIHEALKIKKKHFKTLFERKWNGSDYDFEARDFGENPEQIPQRKNASIIATALLLNNSAAARFYSAFNSCYGNLYFLGRDSSLDPKDGNVFKATDFFDRNHDHLQWVNQRLTGFDLGLEGINIRKLKHLDPDTGKEVEQNYPMARHQHNGQTFELFLLQESQGTQALYVLLSHLLPVLEYGGVAFIDEIETSLHSHMLPSIIDLFYSKNFNKRNAQLIFTCHSDYVLHHLEKYQIQLVEKDKDGASRTYRLDDIKGVRNVDNHYAKYHAGVYGGIPNI